ncbi:hypothetical protein ACI3PL_20880, partial [Lacticaseibacillus paracasei]
GWGSGAISPSGYCGLVGSNTGYGGSVAGATVMLLSNNITNWTLDCFSTGSGAGFRNGGVGGAGYGYIATTNISSFPLNYVGYSLNTLTITSP